VYAIAEITLSRDVVKNLKLPKSVNFQKRREYLFNKKITKVIRKSITNIEISNISQ
jgi:hypothetical protein